MVGRVQSVDIFLGKNYIQYTDKLIHIPHAFITLKTSLLTPEWLEDKQMLRICNKQGCAS